MTKEKLKICIVSYLFHEAFITPLSNLEALLNYISPETYSIICGFGSIFDKKFKYKNTYIIYHRKNKRVLLRILGFISTQMHISLQMIYLSRKVDTYLFFMEGGIFLPILIAKCLKKNVVWMLPSSFVKMEEYNKDFLSCFLFRAQIWSYELANKIILYSPHLSVEFGLTDFYNKTLIASQHNIDFNKFTYYDKFKVNSFLIGYIGRLSKEKGIINFINAIPCVVKKKNNVKFLVIGDGALKKEVEIYINKNNLCNYVRFVNWIPNNNIPKYLHELDLLVLPSYTEGLPNIILEAMACGTPVLATAVGAIPDLVVEGVTGFMMENNSPECIAANIIRSMEDHTILRIAQNARKFVEREFSFEAAVGRWETVLTKIKD